MKRSSSHALLRAARLAHLYLGVFTAPALLFFAFTGALQTFSLHETSKGGSYMPPRWAVVLGQIHKKQTPVVALKKYAAPVPKGEPSIAATAESQYESAKSSYHYPLGETPRVHHPLPMKIFFLAVSVGLLLSTTTGICMSYKYMRDRRVVTALVVLGILIPVILVFV